MNEIALIDTRIRQVNTNFRQIKDANNLKETEKVSLEFKIVTKLFVTLEYITIIFNRNHYHFAFCRWFRSSKCKCNSTQYHKIFSLI